MKLTNKQLSASCVTHATVSVVRHIFPAWAGMANQLLLDSPRTKRGMRHVIEEELPGECQHWGKREPNSSFFREPAFLTASAETL